MYEGLSELWDKNFSFMKSNIHLLLQKFICPAHFMLQLFREKHDRYALSLAISV
jgi:hypothetical protein